MRQEWTEQELDYLKSNYEKLGPWQIAKNLNRTKSSVHHKGRRLGLWRGQAAGASLRQNHWQFKEWSPELAYVVGVYLGDGNVWQAKGTCSYFRHSSIDRDFCETTAMAVAKATGFNGSIYFQESKQQWCYTFCNKDFASWLTERYGSAGNKRITLTGSNELDLWTLLGIWDSEGTVNSGGSMNIRMIGNLYPLLKVVDFYMNRGKRSKGVLLQKDGLSRLSWPVREWAKIGMGTFIKRKSMENLRLMTGFNFLPKIVIPCKKSGFRKGTIIHSLMVRKEISERMKVYWQSKKLLLA